VPALLNLSHRTGKEIVSAKQPVQSEKTDTDIAARGMRFGKIRKDHPGDRGQGAAIAGEGDDDQRQRPAALAG